MCVVRVCVCVYPGVRCPHSVRKVAREVEQQKEEHERKLRKKKINKERKEKFGIRKLGKQRYVPIDPAVAIPGTITGSMRTTKVVVLLKPPSTSPSPHPA